MDEFHSSFSRLRIRDVQLSTTKCILDRDARLLSISGWSQCLAREVVIALTIVNETDQLEWTCMIDSVLHRTAADEPFQVKISSSSVNHRFIVTTKVLRRISDRNEETKDVECYEVASESHCTAKRSSTDLDGVATASAFPVFDVRPHLRSNVGIRSDSDMLSILTAGSRLPIEKSESLICTGKSLKLKIYQGDNERVLHNKRVHSIELEFQSEELDKRVTVTLDVTEDGTLTTTAKERNYGNTKSTSDSRVIDVICPKIAIDTTDPELQVECTQNVDHRKKAILVIETTYGEIDRWRVSLAETGVATGNGRHVLLFPRDGFSQQFEIPSNIFEAGVSYECTVEGLQLIDDPGVDSSRNFRIICRNSATLLIPALQVDLDLQIQIQRSPFNQTSVLISTNPQAAPVNRKWKISIKKISTTTEPVSLYHSPTKEFVAGSQRFNCPLEFEAGSRYRVTVSPMEWSGGFYQNPDESVRQTTEFRAASQVNLDLQIQIQRSTVHHASVLIFTNPRAAPANRKWKISVQKIATTTGPLSLHCSPTKEFAVEGQKFDFPLQFQSGHRYQVTVEPLEWSGGIYQNPDNSVKQTAEFRAELTLEDIKALYCMARQRAAGYGSSPCHWLYRNKSPRYFQDIELNQGRIMKVYDKDNSGDPASPINLQIKGLFFLASVERGTASGEPIRVSPFGPTRVCIPAEELLAMASNVYFVDFYCMRGLNHQVTLVMTRPGSETDRFCAERLLLLDLHDPTNNPFLFYDSSGQLRVSMRDQLLVELLYTEDLDISGYSLTQVSTVGRGSSTPGGIPINAACTLCNIQRPSAF